MAPLFERLRKPPTVVNVLLLHTHGDVHAPEGGTAVGEAFGKRLKFGPGAWERSFYARPNGLFGGRARVNVLVRGLRESTPGGAAWKAVTPEELRSAHQLISLAPLDSETLDAHGKPELAGPLARLDAQGAIHKGMADLMGGDEIRAKVAGAAARAAHPSSEKKVLIFCVTGSGMSSLTASEFVKEYSGRDAHADSIGSNERLETHEGMPYRIVRRAAGTSRGPNPGKPMERLEPHELDTADLVLTDIWAANENAPHAIERLGRKDYKALTDRLERLHKEGRVINWFYNTAGDNVVKVEPTKRDTAVRKALGW